MVSCEATDSRRREPARMVATRPSRRRPRRVPGRARQEADVRARTRSSLRISGIWSVLISAVAGCSAGPPADEIRMLIQGLPGMTIDTLPGAGHHLPEERPDRVVAALLAVPEALTVVAKP